jgi:hypothetical protein
MAEHTLADKPPDDYLDRDALLALGIDEADADALLADSPLSGHDGRPVVEADRLDELLTALRQTRRGPA